MRRVYKYELSSQEEQSIEIPRGGQILSVQVQHNLPQMWVLVNPGNPSVERRFSVYGTGHDIVNDALEYVGTFQLLGGRLVFHVFERLT